MDFKNLSPDLQKKAEACKTEEELNAVAQEAGCKLSDDALDDVSGGGNYCPKQTTGCSKVMNLGGGTCRPHASA